MKKTILAIVCVLMLLITGLSTVIANDVMEECSICEKNNEFFQDPQYENYGFFQTLENIIGKSGIKIWAQGWGNFSCRIVEDNPDDPYQKWGPIVVRWQGDNLIEVNKNNSISYEFKDDEAQTLYNYPFPLPIPNFGLISWILMLYFPDLLRFNQRIPNNGSGSHSSSWFMFQGWISKGQNFTGDPRDPKVINGKTYAFYEIRGRCSGYFYSGSFDSTNGHRIRKLNYLLWVLKNRKNDDLIPWDCCIGNWWKD